MCPCSIDFFLLNVFEAAMVQAMNPTIRTPESCLVKGHYTFPNRVQMLYHFDGSALPLGCVFLWRALVCYVAICTSGFWMSNSKKVSGNIWRGKYLQRCCCWLPYAISEFGFFLIASVWWTYITVRQLSIFSCPCSGCHWPEVVISYCLVKNMGA